jgi:hypothetical protein
MYALARGGRNYHTRVRYSARQPDLYQEAILAEKRSFSLDIEELLGVIIRPPEIRCQFNRFWPGSALDQAHEMAELVVEGDIVWGEEQHRLTAA